MANTIPLGAARAAIQTSVDVLLKDMDETEVVKLIGKDEENLKKLAMTTEAKVLFDKSTLTVTIYGNLKHVKNCHQVITRQIEEIKEGSIFEFSNFHLLDEELLDGLAFESYNSDTWVAISSPLMGSGNEGKGDKISMLQQAATKILQKISYVSKNKNLRMKVNLSLGKAIFTKYFTSDLKMNEAVLTPKGFRQLIETKDLVCSFDVVHDHPTISNLESLLLELGFQRHPQLKTVVYISHREVHERKANEVLWVTRPSKEHYRANGPNDFKGQLELMQVRINEGRACLITSHSTGHDFDCHAEFTVYYLESEAKTAALRERLRTNFRFQESGKSLIMAKEKLQDPAARVRVSTRYVKEGTRIVVSKVKESQSEGETWEISIKSEELRRCVKAALAGQRITAIQIQNALESYFDTVTTVNARMRGGNLMAMGNSKTMEDCMKQEANATLMQPKVTASISPLIRAKSTPSKLNCNAPPFEPLQPWKPMGTPSFILEPQKQTQEIAQLSTIGHTPLQLLPGNKLVDSHPVLMPSHEPWKHMASPALTSLSANGIENLPPLTDQMLPSPSKTTFESNLIDDPIVEEDKCLKRKGKIPPPNTPASPSGSGSLRSSRAGSIVAEFDDDDDLCGVVRTPPKLPAKKSPFDLLGSIDELLMGKGDEENDENLICLSPETPNIGLDEDLLVPTDDLLI